MANEVISPLGAIVRRMASREVVNGPAAQIEKRFERARETFVVVCDCSLSMADTIGSLGISKYEQLVIALNDVLTGWPKVRIVACHSIAYLVPAPDKLPKPMGCTNLAAGLEEAGRLFPSKTIVISDGLPDNKEQTVAAAQAMTGTIDTIYCGPDNFNAACEFLRSLSRQTGGIAATWDGYRAGIAETIRGLLPPPEKP